VISAGRIADVGRPPSQGRNWLGVSGMVWHLLTPSAITSPWWASMKRTASPPRET